MTQAGEFYQLLFAMSLLKEMKIPMSRLEALHCSGLLTDLLAVDPTTIDRNGLRYFIGLPQALFKIRVNYGKSTEALIRDGKYDRVCKEIRDFQTSGKGFKDITVEPICLGRPASTEQVTAEILGRGLRMATFAELLTFGATFPDFQRTCSITSLGAPVSIQGEDRFPSLCMMKSGRALTYEMFERRWCEDQHFLAVH